MALTVGLLLGACAPQDARTIGDSEIEGDGMCGELQCSDGLRISLTAEGGVFVAGDYQLHVSSDGAPQVCGFRIEGDPDACFGDPPCLAADECGLSYSFSALPHSASFVVGPQPSVVELGIVRDGQTIGGETLAPQYDEHTPNGADCPPVCLIASAQVPVR